MNIQTSKSVTTVLLCLMILLTMSASVSANEQPLPLPHDPQGNHIRAIESFQEQQKLTASDGDVGDRFGQSVAIDGDTALIGAILDSDNGTYRGSAYVYVFTAGSWEFQQKLTASDGADFASFGVSVALDDDTALIGSSANSAYVFTRTNGVWTEQAILTVTGTSNFGTSVSLDADTALVGDSQYFSNQPGSAYVFTRTNDVWTMQAKLTASDGASGDEFGVSVSLDGDSALIGARYDDDDGDGSGSAYVFTHINGVWTQQAKLTASDGASGDIFGQSVSLSGDSALVGAIGDDDKGDASGSAYVFTRTNGIWTEQAKLTASDGASGDFFGIRVSLSGDSALVGAYNDDSKGSAYFFVRDNTGVWTEQAKLTASDSITDHYFGWSVSLDGDSALIGAYYDDSQKGGAYFFDLMLEVELSTDSASGAEGDSGTTAPNLSIVVGGKASTVANSIDIALTAGSATSGSDYTQTNATITIPAGDYTTPQTIAIPLEALGIVGDTLVEGDEMLTVTLTDSSGGVRIADVDGDSATISSATYTILNDDLLVNGSFEIAGDKDKKADGWTRKKLSWTDKRICGVESVDGNCAFMFNLTGTVIAGNSNRTLKQSISDHGVVAGDTLTFNGYRKATGLTRNGKIVVKAKYYRDSVTNRWVTQKMKFTIPSGDYPYTAMTDSMVLTDTPVQIVVVIKVKPAVGTFYVDDLSLTHTSATTLRAETRGETLPLPEAPRGFRD